MIISINEMFNLPVGTVFRTKGGTVGEIIEHQGEVAYQIPGMDTVFDLEWTELPAEIIYFPFVNDPRYDV